MAIRLAITSRCSEGLSVRCCHRLETVVQKSCLLASVLLILITSCASAREPERAVQSWLSQSVPETLPMRDDNWQTSFLDSEPWALVETSVFHCGFAAKTPWTDIMVGHEDPVGDALFAAGNPNPTQGDRDWALSARRDQLLNDCEQEYGPRVRIISPDLFVDVDGRDTGVDLGASSFVAIPLTPGNTLWRAWWDLGHRYVVVDLAGSFRHHCGVSQTAIEDLAAAEDVDAHYQLVADTLGDCPIDGVVPDYSHNYPAGDWHPWSDSVHAAIADDVDFDPHPMAYPKQLGDIAGELIHLCANYRGKEIDLDEFNRSLGITPNEAQFHVARFRYKVAEEYNRNASERRAIC